MEPDYTSYTDDELEDVRRHIDAIQHPERAARLEAEIESRKSSSASSVSAGEIGDRDIAEEQPRRSRAPIAVGIVALLIGLSPVMSHFESLLHPFAKQNNEAALKMMERVEEEGGFNENGFERDLWDAVKNLADPPAWFVYYSFANGVVGLGIVGLHGLAGFVLLLRRRSGATLLVVAAGANVPLRLVAICVGTLGLGFPLIALALVLGIGLGLDAILLALAARLRRLAPEAWNTAEAT